MATGEPHARRERAARVLDEWSTKTDQFPSHVVGISHVEIREWERLIDMITIFAAQEAEQASAQARGELDTMLSHTRIIPENGRRVTMKGHGQDYDAALERLIVALSAASPPGGK